MQLFVAPLERPPVVMMARRPAGIPVDEGPVRHEAALLDHVAERLGPQRRHVEAQRVEVPAAPAREPDHHAPLHRVREGHPVRVRVPERPVHRAPARCERHRPHHRRRRPAVRRAVAAADARQELVREVHVDLHARQCKSYHIDLQQFDLSYVRFL